MIISDSISSSIVNMYGFNFSLRKYLSDCNDMNRSVLDLNWDKFCVF